MKLGQFRTLEGAANASFFSWVKFQYKLLLRIKWEDIVFAITNLINAIKLVATLLVWFVATLLVWFVVVILSPLILPVLIPVKMRMAKKELAEEKKKESKEKLKNPYY